MFNRREDEHDPFESDACESVYYPSPWRRHLASAAFGVVLVAAVVFVASQISGCGG